MGFALVTGLRGFDVPQIKRQIAAYRTARHEAEHPGDGSVYLRIPVYVADTEAQARSEPEESTIRSYRRLAENFAASVGEAGTTAGEERARRAEALSQVTYDELLQDRVAYGTPDMVVERLRRLRDDLGLSGVVMEPNVGGASGRRACSGPFDCTPRRSPLACTVTRSPVSLDRQTRAHSASLAGAGFDRERAGRRVRPGSVDCESARSTLL